MSPGRPSAAVRRIAVYRLNGRRYLKLITDLGAVLVPATGELPELRDDQALCPQHLKLLQEALKLRDDFPIAPGLKDREAEITALVRRCTERQIRGPVLTERQPDGAVVEIKAPR